MNTAFEVKTWKLMFADVIHPIWLSCNCVAKKNCWNLQSLDVQGCAKKHTKRLGGQIAATGDKVFTKGAQFKCTPHCFEV